MVPAVDDGGWGLGCWAEQLTQELGSKDVTPGGLGQGTDNMNMGHWFQRVQNGNRTRHRLM